jgi:hypothetical protein
MTKTSALREFRTYMHDVRAEARREGYSVDTIAYWFLFLDTLCASGRLDAMKAIQWAQSGPR